VPGASLLVAIGGTEILARGYGKADLENDVSVTPQTVFRIGSITKQFTAAAILQLVDAGRLKLDARLDELLPAFAFAGKKVTLHQLLNHTSGIRSYTGLGRKFWSRVNERISHEQLYELIKDEPFDFEPGAGWKYNNSGYYLLGVIIEKVSDKSYAEFVGEQLFKPVGMTKTRYGGSDQIVKHRARGYTKSKGKVVNCRLMSMRAPFAAGGLLSTTRDLHRWNLALHGGKVLARDSYRKMTTATGKAAPRGYGYGLMLRERKTGREISHGGGIFGFSTANHHVPKHRLTVTLLYNTDAVRPGRLAAQILREVLKTLEK